MKKFIGIIAFSISLFLFGCITTEKQMIEITDISISTESRGVSVELDIKQSDIVAFGILIVNHEVNDIEDINFDTLESYYEQTDVENNVFTINISEDDYTTTFSVRAYTRNSKNDTALGDYKTFNLYDLAKDGDCEYCEDVISRVEKKVRNVGVTIDYSNDTITPISDLYQAQLQRQDNDLIVSVVLIEGYSFRDEVTLIINDQEIDDFTITTNLLEYQFVDPNYIPPQYGNVDVTFDLNGGLWTSEVFTQLPYENILTLTSVNDTTGSTYTVLDTEASTYRWYYKLFIKYDQNIDAYQIVATDSATSNISDLTLPDYDYVLSVHDDCLDTVAFDTIKAYTEANSIGTYVVFGSEVTEDSDNSTAFYSHSTLTNEWEQEFYEAISLPIAFREGYEFLGWSDGINTYTVFPRYLLEDNVESVVYTAVWDPHSYQEFIDTMETQFADEIDRDVSLPTSFSEYLISWSSDDPDTISNSGEYNRPYHAKTMTLTATITSVSKTEDYTFEVSVAGYKELKPGIASSYIYRNYNSVNDEFFDTLDIINCAFIGANANGELFGTTFLNNVKNYIMPKAQEKGVWVVMSISPSAQWSTIAADPILIQRFANNIVKAINEYGFDGVDIDWETPTDAEKTNFTALMKEVYSKVKANNPNHLVSAAITGGMWQPPRYDLDNSAQYIDYINMMTYGMLNSNGYYQNALYPSTVFNNPSFKVGRTITSCSIEESVAFFNNNYQIPNHKIIVGVAFYGIKQTRTSSTSGWSSWARAGSVSYHNIVKDYYNNSNYTVYYDDDSQVPYIVKNDGTEFISYDNPKSIIAKSNYVLTENLGGIMYWEHFHDNTGILLAAIKEGLNK